MKRRRILWMSVFLVLMSMIWSAFTSERGSRYFEIAKNLDIYASLFREVNKYYVEDINPNTMMRTGIDAMLESLDPYTNYIPEDEIENFRTLSTGQYGGIGALTVRREGRVVVTEVFEGFAADKGGLKVADVVTEVNGIPIADKSKEEVDRLVKGQAKTNVVLTVERFGSAQPIKLDIKRERITIKSVPYFGMVDENVGYIKLAEFTMNCSRDVAAAFKELRIQGAQKFVLDLRDNPGGLLIEAVNIVNLFIPKGQEVVSTRGKIEENNAVYRSLNDPMALDIPLIILINENSASASEIVAGALQDYDRAVLIGRKSFGKGLVQTTRKLSYNSQLKVTTAKYYIPSGRLIQSIDYSNQGLNGERIPDSLKTAFRTKNGRTVFDIGGIDADISIERQRLAPVTISLLTNGLIFDYATQYYYSNPEIASPGSFTISDNIYTDFATWVSNKDYSYTTGGEKVLDNLEKLSAREKSDKALSADLEKLRIQISKSKESDVRQFNDEIGRFLRQEIVKRYYYRSGQIQSSFHNDPYLVEARKIFSDPNEMDRILSYSGD